MINKKFFRIIYLLIAIIIAGHSLSYSYDDLELQGKDNLEIKYEYDSRTNTVIAKIISKIELKDTKPTWKLSEDKMSYSKKYLENEKYSTVVEDILGNVYQVEIDINQIDDKGPVIETIYEYDKKTNTVIVTMNSNEEMSDTKPTWKLSQDKLKYTKTFNKNEKYKTVVEDIYGNKTEVEINIEQIDDKGPVIETSYEYDKKTNTVMVTMNSNEEMSDTKPTWKLSQDKLKYTKTFNKNEKYKTIVEDIYGNKTEIEINIEQIDDKGPVIEISYEYDKKTNTVTATMSSNEEMNDTKPTWKLSQDKLKYTKEFDKNEEYKTIVEDIYGNKTEVKIKINQIDDKPPVINLEYVYNTKDDTVTVIMNSDEPLGDTKPTWELSKDQMTYTKTYKEDQEYATPVEDIYGNKVWVKIKINTKSFTYTNNKGPNIKVKYLYDSNEQVTVYIVSDKELKNTKPTWNLSEDRFTYTKTFKNNESYTTNVVDIEGNEVKVSILVNFFKNTLKGIDVSEFQKIIDWQQVKNTGIDFAIIRAGYRGWGSGKLVTDMFFDRNIKEATKVGMDIGIYFFTQAVTEDEAREEARYTVNLLSKYNVPIRYPIAIDTERTPPGNGRGDGISKSQRTKVVQAFCQEIEKAGYKSMIYGNRNWLLNDLEIENLSQYDIWLADYINTTSYKYPYTIWQYTSSGTVNGIAGRVDMNIGYKRY